MIEEHGTVVLCHDRWAQVETVRQASCGSCSAQSSCGVSLLDRFLGRRPTRLSALNEIAATPGQRVVVGIPEGSILSAAVAAYLVPLLGLIGGGILGQELASKFAGGADDLVSLGGGLVGLCAGLVWLARFSRTRSGDARYQAVVLRLADEAPAPEVRLLMRPPAGVSQSHGG